MPANDTSPDVVIRPNPSIKVTKKHQPVITGNSLEHGSKAVVVEQIFGGFIWDKSWSIRTQNGHVAPFGKWKMQGNESFIYTDRGFSDLGNQRRANGKANSIYAWDIVREAFSKECVPTTNFC